MELGRSGEIASLGGSELRGAARRLHARDDQLERQDLRGGEIAGRSRRDMQG